MSAAIAELVDIWKTRTLHGSDIPLEVACSSIGTDSQIFEAIRINAVEWVLCRKGENTPAIFSYAAVFGSCDPVETGNLVPAGEKMIGVESDRAEPYASFKCSYSYSFDTSNDPGLYLAQGSLDKYMESVPGFNPPVQKPRRTWQSLYNPGSTPRFWMRVPMFIRLRIGERKTPPPEHLHEWVRTADIESRSYRANPARPKVMALEGQRVRRIEDCQPDRLFRGDAVAFTFSVTYIEGRADWYPAFTLIDVVRIASVQSTWNNVDTVSSVVLNSARPALKDGELIVDSENRESDGEIEIVGVPVVDIGFDSPRKRAAADKQLAAKGSSLDSTRVRSETPQSVLENTHGVSEKRQHATGNMRTTPQTHQSVPDTPHSTYEAMQPSIHTQQPLSETPHTVIEPPSAVIESPQLVTESQQPIPDTSQTAIRSPKTVATDIRMTSRPTRSTSATARSTLETSQLVFGSANTVSGTAHSTREPVDPPTTTHLVDGDAQTGSGADGAVTKGKGLAPTTTKLRIQKLTYEDVFGNANDAEGDSSSSSTESSVTTDSEGSSHGGENIQEEVAASATTSKTVEVARSEEGHDSKRKKPNTGPSRRRTKLRR